MQIVPPNKLWGPPNNTPIKNVKKNYGNVSLMKKIFKMKNSEEAIKIIGNIIIDLNPNLSERYPTENEPIKIPTSKHIDMNATLPLNSRFSK